MMRILVTGAGGFIGSHTCRALLKGNHEVFAIARKNNQQILPLLNQDRFHLLTGDICRLSFLEEIMKTESIDVVMHLAAEVTYMVDQDEYGNTNLKQFKSNVIGTLNVLHSCLKTGVSRIIYASTGAVYGRPEYLPIDEKHPKNPIDFYGLTKSHSEDYLRFYAQKYNLHAVVLRYAGIYGPGKNRGAAYNFIKKVLNKQLPQISSDGNQISDFVYVEDAVDVTLKTLDMVDDTTFDVFNIGGGSQISINELLSMIIDIIGAEIEFRYAPRKSDDRFILDITKAQKALGYSPSSLNNALGKFITYIKSNG